MVGKIKLNLLSNAWLNWQEEREILRGQNRFKGAYPEREANCEWQPPYGIGQFPGDLELDPNGHALVEIQSLQHWESDQRKYRRISYINRIQAVQSLKDR